MTTIKIEANERLGTIQRVWIAGDAQEVGEVLQSTFASVQVADVVAWAGSGVYPEPAEDSFMPYSLKVELPGTVTIVTPTSSREIRLEKTPDGDVAAGVDFGQHGSRHAAVRLLSHRHFHHRGRLWRLERLLIVVEEAINNFVDAVQEINVDARPHVAPPPLEHAVKPSYLAPSAEDLPSEDLPQQYLAPLPDGADTRVVVAGTHFAYSYEENGK